MQRVDASDFIRLKKLRAKQNDVIAVDPGKFRATSLYPNLWVGTTTNFLPSRTNTHNLMPARQATADLPK